MLRGKILAVLTALIFGGSLLTFAACSVESESLESVNGNPTVSSGQNTNGNHSSGETGGNGGAKPDEETPDKEEPPEKDPTDTPHVHNPAHTEAVKPTCTAAGNVEYWFCADCNKYFSDESCLNEISGENLDIALKGHTPVKDEAVAADCIHTGLTEGSHCGECGAVLTKQQVIEKTAHQFDSGKCSVCGEWEVSDGLEYEVFGEGYAVKGVGSCKAEFIRIPETHSGKSVLKINDYAFSDYDGIRGLSLPDCVKEIGACAFDGCLYLEEVHTGKVELIGSGAFSRCTNLKTVELSPNLKTLDIQVFNECAGLKEIEVPASVEKICLYAFFCCGNLERIILHKGLKEIEADAFAECPVLGEVVFCGTAEEWNEVNNAAEGNYVVTFRGAE